MSRILNNLQFLTKQPVFQFFHLNPLKNLFVLTLIGFYTACYNPKPEARKPVVQEQKQLPPITENEIAKAVLYEANIRQYSDEGTFNAFAEDLPVLKDLGVKILWLMPVNPVSETKSKGALGSYYAVSNHNEVNPEFGTLEDFKALVSKAHELGIYVILDWVLGHTGWDHPWIEENSNYYLKNRKGEIINPIISFAGKSFAQTDLASLNYTNVEMQEAMRKALLYWVKECDIDGYRFSRVYTVPQKFYEKTFKTLREIKPVFLLGETDINQQGIELVSKFDATCNEIGYRLTKAIAQGKKNARVLDKHVNRMLRRYGSKNIIVNFVTNHDENSWNGTVEESYGKAAHAFMALNYTLPGMPLIYSGQEYDLNKRLLFFEKDSFPKTKGKTINLLRKLGALKNERPALACGKKAASYTRLTTSKDNQMLAFQREKDGDTIVVAANLSDDYTQFTMPLNGVFKRYQDLKPKVLSSSYQYSMKPWGFWILMN